MLRLPRRSAALALLSAGVVLAHLWLAQQAGQALHAAAGAAGAPQRFSVAFVRELQQQAPPSMALATALTEASPPRPPMAAPTPPPAASAPTPLALPELAALPPPPPAPALAAASAPAPSASAPASAVASAAADAAPGFEWPPSTRLSYALSGNYRGPVEGQAQVEWLRQGLRYQVHLDVSVGPSFAPVLQRRMSSDGELTATGLRPRRYDEETKVVLRPPRRVTMLFDDERVQLANGRAVPALPGVQDTASQFVQMTWMFTTDPSRLQPGRTVEIALALPRRQDPWIYDVLGTETLFTPFGSVPAVHLKPRLPAGSTSDLTAELWVAPTLLYLPVRIVIRQDAETYVDLLIHRLPEIAAATPAAAPASATAR